MQFESYYIPPESVSGDTLTITGDELHHLSRVKRKRSGEQIRAVDGVGNTYEAEILSISKQEAVCRILSTQRRQGEALTHITIAQSLIKGERFEWFLEKATEIGVSEIIPMTTERTIIKGNDKKLTRWRRIVLSAMKQCGRSVLPDMNEILPFKKVIALGADCSMRFIADAEADDVQPITEAASVPQTGIKSKALVLIGPEGGFSREEISLAVENGFKPVSLGPRRLRAETAGIVSATLILSKTGDLE